MYRFTSFVFLFIGLCSCYAQGYIYQNFDTTNGLSSSQVYDITQDKNGYLWFATDRGLTRYDGYTFKKYEIGDGLTDIVVFNFYEQSDGKIWCSTINKKLFYYDPDSNCFTPYKYNHLLKLFPISDIISHIVVGKDDSLFITFKNLLGYLEIDSEGNLNNQTIPHKNGSVYLIAVKESNPRFFKSFNKEFIKLKKSSYLVREYSKSPWFYKAHYSQKNNVLQIINTWGAFIIDTETGNEKEIKTGAQIIMSGVYNEDHFWVGTQHGGCKIYNNKGKFIEHFLPDKSVSKVFRDHEGGLWLSTLDEGVFYVKNPKVRIYNQHTKERSNHAYRLTKNEKNQVYVSYHNGDVYKREENTFKFINTSLFNYRSTVQYYKKDKRLLVSSRTHLWDEDQGNLSTFVESNNLSDNGNQHPILGISTFWKVTAKDLVKINDSPFFKKRINDVEFSQEGYYLATYSGLYEYKKDSLYPMQGKHPLFTHRIDDIDRYQDTYYMASLGAGLIVKTPDTIYSIDQSDGLNSDLATRVHVENEQEIYVATNAGLNKVFLNSDHTYTISGLSTIEGIPSNEVNDIEISNDTVWVTTKKGLCSFPKSLLSQTNKPVSNWLNIERIEVNNAPIDNLQQIEKLEYASNNITFHFGAISFKNSHDIIYRYRLLGLETDWNSTQNQTVKYPELASNTYTFELQAKKGKENWGEELRRVQFTIAPPFWKAWWFRVLMVLIVILLIYSFFKIRILTYNKYIFKEILRVVLKKIRGKTHYIIIKESGTEVKLNTEIIHFVKSSGNYLEIHTRLRTYLIRETISNFEKLLTDKLEYIRVHRSYLIRIEKVQQKSTNSIQILNQTIPVGKTYKEQLNRVVF